MTEWPAVPLGELLSRSEEWIKLKPLDSYTQVTVKLWGQGVVERSFVTGQEIGANSRLVVRANQLLLSRIDARNGAIGLVPQRLDGAVVSNDFPAFSIVSERLHPKFLEFYTKTQCFVEACKSVSEGTTNRVRLKEDRFLKLTIPLPSFEEQRRIVSVFEHVAGSMSAVSMLAREVQDDLRRLIVGFHLAASNGRTLRIAEMLDLCEERVVVETASQYPQVGVKGFGQGLFLRDAVTGTATTYKYFNRLYEGCLVLSQVKGWEGAIAVCNSTYAGRFVSPEYRTFRCKPGILLPDYLSILVETPWFCRKLADITRGVGARRERTRPEQFLAMRIEMPTVQQQVSYTKLLHGVRFASTIRAGLFTELKALLPATLARVFAQDAVEATTVRA